MKYWKRILGIVLISVLTVSSLWYWNRTLMTKRNDGVTPMQNFYAQSEDTVDVLLMGSSHVGMNLDTGILWDKYGISSYDFWGSIQLFWTSYYWLEEALKTQNPKVVVLDVYAAAFSCEYIDDARQVMNIAGMKPSLTKLKNIMISSPKDRWLKLLIGYPIWNSRYNELTENDFSHYPWSDGLAENKGSYAEEGSGEYELEDASEITEVHEIYEKEQVYLKKIIDLCQEKGIEIVLIKTPVSNRVELQPYFNAVSEIAEQEGVAFYNFNLMDDETGFESCDWLWDGGHVNAVGARKISDYLGKILVEEYDVVDHRGDSRYDSWENSRQVREYRSSLEQ